MWKQWCLCSHWAIDFRIKMFKFHFVTFLVDSEINKNTLLNGTNFTVQVGSRNRLSRYRTPSSIPDRLEYLTRSGSRNHNVQINENAKLGQKIPVFFNI